MQKPFPVSPVCTGKRLLICGTRRRTEMHSRAYVPSEKGSFTKAYPLRRPTMDKKKTVTTIKVTDLPKKAVSAEEAKKVKGGRRHEHGTSTGS